MNQQGLTAGQEWRRNWPLVLAAMVGLSFGAVPSATLGLFIGPLEADFGWNRAEISFGMTIFAIVGLPLGPLIGLLVDRFGARRLVIPGLILVGANFAAFSLMTGVYWQWVALWVLYTFASVFIRSLVWNTAISGSFLAGRGLAIAVVLAGFAIAQTIAPPLTEWLIESRDWRSAYALIGLGWTGVALALVVPFFRDRSGSPSISHQASHGESSAQHRSGGISVRQALRTPVILRIGLAIALQALVGTGVLIHLVPMLGWAGMSRAEAAALAGLLGLASFTGTFIAGWLMDRIRNELVPLGFFAAPALGHLALLQAGSSGAMLTAAVLVIGVGSGGALQIGIYLVTRHAGIRNFGTIYGIISSFQSGLAGLGPLLAGLIFDASGTYALVLWLAAPMTMLTGLLVFGLGPYPDFRPDPKHGRPQANEAR